MTNHKTPRDLDDTALDAATGGAGSYNFFEAWPSKWKGFSLDGKGNDTAIETVEIAHEGLTLKKD